MAPSDEDARLLGCLSVPLSYRLLYGFLSREGMRKSEALGLTWGDIDLARGAVCLDANKTDDPRTWALDPGVAEALRRAWVAPDRRHPRPRLARAALRRHPRAERAPPAPVEEAPSQVSSAPRSKPP